MLNSIVSVNNVDNVRKTKPLIVLFFSDSCFYCQKMRPDWEKFKESSPINYSEIPVEQMSEYHPVKQEENIKGYPTIRLYDNGKIIKEYDGDRSHKDIMKFVKKHVKQNKKKGSKSKIHIVKGKSTNTLNNNLLKTIQNTKSKKGSKKGPKKGSKKGPKKGSKKGPKKRL